MKVLHLTDDLSLMGGVQRYLATLQAVLPSQGVECWMWAPEPGRMDGSLSRWYGRRHRAEVRDMIERRRPDVVHAHNLWMRLSPLPLEAAKQAGIPVVVTAHDYAWVCPRKWMISGDDRPCALGFGWRCALSRCRASREGRIWLPYNALRWLKTHWHRSMVRSLVDRFVSPSRHLARFIECSLGVNGVACIPNFAPEPRGGVASPVRNPHTLLFAGRLSREKGVDVLLRSLPKVVERYPEAQLVIAGEGPERESLGHQAENMGIARAVRFEGALGSEGLEPLFADASLVVLPSLWMENCPVSVLEAFAHARAVVASRSGGVPELIDDGRTGVLFERGDHRDLEQRLIELMADPARIEAMGRNAAAAWAAEYTPEIHGRRLRDLYESLLAGAG